MRTCTMSDRRGEGKRREIMEQRKYLKEGGSKFSQTDERQKLPLPGNPMNPKQNKCKETCIFTS